MELLLSLRGADQILSPSLVQVLHKSENLVASKLRLLQTIAQKLTVFGYRSALSRALWHIFLPFSFSVI